MSDCLLEVEMAVDNGYFIVVRVKQKFFKRTVLRKFLFILLFFIYLLFIL